MDNRQNLLTIRVLYLLWVIFGIFSLLYIPSQLIDFKDATLTAEQVAKNETLYRAGVMGRLITQLLFLIVVWFLYKFFHEVSRDATYLMMLFTFVSVPIAMYNEVNALYALRFLASPEEVMDLLRLHQNGILLATIFWGLWLFPLGYLVYHSPLFPRFLGIALYVGGVGYLIGAFAKIVFPGVEMIYSISETMTMGEMVWVLWVIFVGSRKKRSVDIKS